MAERRRQTAQAERRRRFVRRLCPLLFWAPCPSGNYHYVWEAKCYCAASGDEPPLRWIAGSWHRGYRARMFVAPQQSGTTSVPSLPGEQSFNNALAEGRERWPNQPIPGCCGFTKPTGRCCVETNVPQPDEEEDDGGHGRD